MIGVEFGRPDVVGMLLTPLCIGYALSRHFETGVDNGKELVAHTTFRYFAFWLMTYAHSFAFPFAATMSHGDWMTVCCGLTPFYVLHIFGLHYVKRVR